MSKTMFKPVLTTATFACLAAACLAQDTSDNSTQTCPRPYDDFTDGTRHINSTGSVSFALEHIQNDPWYLSIALTDYRDPLLKRGDDNTYQEKAGFLSVPESWAGSYQAGKVDYCMYSIPGRNATSEGDEGDCRGVVSEECLKVLESTPGTWASNCWGPDYEEACGPGHAFTTSPRNFSSTECTLDSMPHLDLPDGYVTYTSLPAWSDARGGQDYDNFDQYDLAVKQTMPIVLTINLHLEGGGIRPAKEVLCLAPDNVVEGSRVPELEFESSAENETDSSAENGTDSSAEDDGNESSASHVGGLAAVAVAVVVGLVVV